MEIKVIVQEEKFFEIKERWNAIVGHMKVKSPFKPGNGIITGGLK